MSSSYSDEELIQLASDIESLSPAEQRGVALICARSQASETRHGIVVNLRWVPDEVLRKLLDYVRYHRELASQEGRVRASLASSCEPAATAPRPASTPRSVSPESPGVSRGVPLVRTELELQWAQTLRRYLRLQTSSRKI